MFKDIKGLITAQRAFKAYLRANHSDMVGNDINGASKRLAHRLGISDDEADNAYGTTLYIPSAVKVFIFPKGRALIDHAHVIGNDSRVRLPSSFHLAQAAARRPSILSFHYYHSSGRLSHDNQTRVYIASAALFEGGEPGHYKAMKDFDDGMYDSEAVVSALELVLAKLL